MGSSQMNSFDLNKPASTKMATTATNFAAQASTQQSSEQRPYK